MLPDRYRRLWRRRLRRRPLLPFLLLATVAVDLVMLSDSFTMKESFLIGLVVGQIGLLGIWVTHSRSGILSRVFLVLVLTLFAIAVAIGIPFDRILDAPQEARIYLDLRPVYMAVLLSSLGIATTCSLFVRVVVGTLGTGRSFLQPIAMQFRIKDLFWICTTTAVLLSFLGYAQWSALNDLGVAISLIVEAITLVIALAVALCVRKEPARFSLLVMSPMIVLALSVTTWTDGLVQYCATVFAFLTVWLYLAGDRGPALEPLTVEEKIEPSSASIDLRA